MVIVAAEAQTTTTVKKTEYLIIQEFFDLSRGADGGKATVTWFKLKRKEVKHWWWKEERGARGMKVGFYKLIRSKDIESE